MVLEPECEGLNRKPGLSDRTQPLLCQVMKPVSDPTLPCQEIKPASESSLEVDPAARRSNL